MGQDIDETDADQPDAEADVVTGDIGEEPTPTQEVTLSGGSISDCSVGGRAGSGSSWLLPLGLAIAGIWLRRRTAHQP